VSAPVLAGDTTRLRDCKRHVNPWYSHVWESH
jgi:hypothetical protein